MIPCPDTLDPTMGGTIDECLRKFFYRHITGIAPTFEPDYFAAGRAWDAAMGEWFSRSEPEAAKRYQAAVRSIYRAYETSTCSLPREKRTPENLVELFNRFVSHHVEPPYTVIRSNVAFRLPFSDFYLGGELDQYCHWERFGVVVHENKTTTIIPGSKGFENYVDGFALGRYANQILQYIWAASQLTEQVWGARILVACLDIPKRASTERKLFEAIWLHRSPIRLAEYLDLCRYRMAKVRNAWKTWDWPKEGQQCAGGWGFNRCEYFHLCSQHASLEDIEVPESYFRIGVPWAPWDGEKGDQK